MTGFDWVFLDPYWLLLGSKSFSLIFTEFYWVSLSISQNNHRIELEKKTIDSDGTHLIEGAEHDVVVVGGQIDGGAASRRRQAGVAGGRRRRDAAGHRRRRRRRGHRRQVGVARQRRRLGRRFQRRRRRRRRGRRRRRRRRRGRRDADVTVGRRVVVAEDVALKALEIGPLRRLNIFKNQSIKNEL